MYDYIIVGGGIGGVVAFSLLKRLGKNVLLLEKLDYLGGCAGTFKKDGMFYNVGASTLVGLDEKLPLDILVKILNIKKRASSCYTNRPIYSSFYKRKSYT